MGTLLAFWPREPPAPAVDAGCLGSGSFDPAVAAGQADHAGGAGGCLTHAEFEVARHLGPRFRLPMLAGDPADAVQPQAARHACRAIPSNTSRVFVCCVWVLAQGRWPSNSCAISSLVFTWLLTTSPVGFAAQNSSSATATIPGWWRAARPCSRRRVTSTSSARCVSQPCAYGGTGSSADNAGLTPG
jgi:hypothetical protein